MKLRFNIILSNHEHKVITNDNIQQQLLLITDYAKDIENFLQNIQAVTKAELEPKLHPNVLHRTLNHTPFHCFYSSNPRITMNIYH